MDANDPALMGVNTRLRVKEPGVYVPHGAVELIMKKALYGGYDVNPPSSANESQTRTYVVFWAGSNAAPTDVLTDPPELIVAKPLPNAAIVPAVVVAGATGQPATVSVPAVST